MFFSRFYLFLLLLPSACAVQPATVLKPQQPSSYRSELADPTAKAFYAYAEFRLLAVENRWDEAIEDLRRAVVFDPETSYLRMRMEKELLHKDKE